MWHYRGERKKWKLELNQINEPCLRKEASGFMSSAVLQDQCCETQLQGSTKRVEVRSELCMVWGWGGVGRGWEERSRGFGSVQGTGSEEPANK